MSAEHDAARAGVRNPRIDPRSGDVVMLFGQECRVTLHGDTIALDMFKDGERIGYTACDLRTWRKWNESELELCEACSEPATRVTADGVPLCEGDYLELMRQAATDEDWQ